MKQEQQTKVLKLLNLSSSSNDGEALNSIRIANEILKKHKLDWEKFMMFPKMTDAQSRRTTGKEHPDDEIQVMFELVLKRVEGQKAEEFINSIHSFWKRTGFLTKKQETALRKFYDNCN